MIYNPSTIKNKFFNCVSYVEQNISQFVHNPGHDMTRNRICTLRDTIMLIFTSTMLRNNTEILQYFLPSGSAVPTKSAFTQQRKKLTVGLFQHLFQDFNKSVPFTNKYKGYHLIAVDGSDINLPTDKNDDVYCVKQARSDRKYYQMHLNALFDILENRYVDAVTQPRSKYNEGEAFCDMLDRYSIRGKSIFIADRGYESHNTIANIIEKNQYFLIRAKTPFSGGILNHLIEKEELTDKTVTLGITRSRKNQYTKNPKRYRCIKNRVFTMIPLEDKDSVYEMTFRCVCLQLDNGNYEYLITNLPQKDFPVSELKKLYGMRWGIETSFRRLKYALSLVYFHSQRRDLIQQELYARLTLYNITSLLHRYAEGEKPETTTKHTYKVSFEGAVAVTRCFLKEKLTNKKVKALLLMHLTMISESKSSERRVRSQTSKPFNSRA